MLWFALRKQDVILNASLSQTAFPLVDEGFQKMLPCSVVLRMFISRRVEEANGGSGELVVAEVFFMFVSLMVGFVCWGFL